MDRFKFRVWDETRKKYWGKEEWDKKTKCYYDDNYVYLGTDGRLREYHFGDVCLFDKPGQIVEQCTGTKDKNGNLIYEGDILKQTAYAFDPQRKTVHVGCVKWHPGHAQFVFEYPDGTGGHCITELGWGIVEILGNKHNITFL